MLSFLTFCLKRYAWRHDLALQGKFSSFPHAAKLKSFHKEPSGSKTLCRSHLIQFPKAWKAACENEKSYMKCASVALQGSSDFPASGGRASVAGYTLLLLRVPALDWQLSSLLHLHVLQVGSNRP